MTPSDFQHPVVESLPILNTSEGQLIGFRMWDMENMQTEFTVAFLTNDFKIARRVFQGPTEVMDWWSADDSLFVLRRDSVTHVDLAFDEKHRVDLPFAAYAIDGKAATDLTIVGTGIAHFDGVTVDRLDLGVSGVFRSVCIDGTTTHVVGEEGIALTIEAGEIHQWPLKTDTLLNAVVSDDLGLAIAGKAASFRGDGQRLETIDVPADVENMIAVATFQGERYWSADGWGDGYGLFRETPSGLKRISDELPQQMTPDDNYMYLSCAAEVYRFDSSSYVGLGLRFVEDEWVLRSIL